MAFYMQQPAPDNSGAMIATATASANAMNHSSNNMLQLGLAQIGAQEMQSQQSYNLGRRQINADLELGREKLDAKREMATMNYREFVLQEEGGHQERMKDLSIRQSEIDAARAGVVV